MIVTASGVAAKCVLLLAFPSWPIVLLPLHGMHTHGVEAFPALDEQPHIGLLLRLLSRQDRTACKPRAVVHAPSSRPAPLPPARRCAAPPPGRRQTRGQRRRRSAQPGCGYRRPGHRLAGRCCLPPSSRSRWRLPPGRAAAAGWGARPPWRRSAAGGKRWERRRRERLARGGGRAPSSAPCCTDSN